MPTRRTNRTPLVFVPGVFGSMSSSIIRGTGHWSFGVAGVFYEPFIDMLKQMGYRLHMDLFIAYYDWRQRIPDIVENYLKPVIQEAKRVSGASRVNLVCHSMGGLVARGYVQSLPYWNDVDQLIMLCTPNAGSPSNYVYWTGGALAPGAETPENIVTIAMNSYLDNVKHDHPDDPIEAVHTVFPSLLELVPAREYGNYLIVGPKEEMRFVPYSAMRVQNAFLDRLNAGRAIIQHRGIQVTVIAGIETRTVQMLRRVQGDIRSEDSGAVWQAILSDTGDGNVLVSSVFVVEGDQYLVEGNHMQVLLRSESILRSKLTRDK
ncbi:esterase/lipase family protein [Paenibacillus guangzhouensis]|uniref:esterase/lipase family protein n=1 Tax=Paenibacillus guangzhouensis TaxID=1473112 RepID=UPI0012672EC1|nr:alpha/beta hydrolase [Paenibacillus guangzhouensis]